MLKGDKLMYYVVTLFANAINIMLLCMLIKFIMLSLSRDMVCSCCEKQLILEMCDDLCWIISIVFTNSKSKTSKAGGGGLG